MTERALQSETISPEFLGEFYRRRRSPWLTTTFKILREPFSAVAATIIIIFTICAVFAPVLAPYSPTDQQALEALQSPSWSHPLGTDQLGRDQLSRMMYGGRVSLGIGIGAVAFACLVGVTLGLIAGYVRGIVDDIIMRLMEMIIAFPGLILALMLIALFEPSVKNLLFAIGIASVPGLARLVRSQVLTVRERDYVLAARSIGAPGTRILFRHIWPNCMAPVIVAATLSMGFAVLAEAGLSFLGVGVRPPTPTWGSMLQFSFGFISLAPYLSIVPGAAIFLLVLSFNILGDALRDAFDPSLRGR
ncbi:MAG TPA: ABC transporter permease [Tepidiformaceae bacterium]|nr:ABC transporter permease [Tepidiformaceae bacterium]HNO64831.1 ABC transporter permease [Tepidiformaceae bacterium]